MAAERVDYYSDEDYEAALFTEDMLLLYSLRKEQEEEERLLAEAEQNDIKQGGQ